MATHQQIANVTDQELVERMIHSHEDRFDAGFWSFFGDHVAPRLPSKPCVVDIGCGPGLLLRDIRKRYPEARLIGSDITPAMIDYAGQVSYEGEKPEYLLHDITTEPLPLDDDSVDLLTIVAVLHVLNDPVAVCREFRRVLKPGGVFLVQDWVRTPLPSYLERMGGEGDEAQQESIRKRLMALFPVHNRYTLDDWLWLLPQTGFRVLEHRHLRSPHFCTFVCEPA